MKNRIVEKRFALDTTIALPLAISRHKQGDKYLFIAPEIPSWLVLSAAEKKAFTWLRSGKTLEQILNLNIEQKVLNNLLAKIELKKFYQNTVSKDRKNLYTATLYLTNYCNLCCQDCYMFSGKPGRGEIDVTSWKVILILLKFAGVKIVTLTGGEPMCKEGFLEILHFAHHLGLKVILLTNGTLINESNYRYLARRCVEIQISVDGPNAELHEKTRGPGTYQKTMNAVSLLSKVAKSLIIAMTPTPETIDGFEKAFPDFLSQLAGLNRGNITVNLTPELQKGRTVEATNRFSNDGFYKKVKYLADKFIEKDYFEKRDALAFVPGEKKHNCGWGEAYTIWWDGSIRPCYKAAKLVNFLDYTSAELKEMVSQQFEKNQVSLVQVCQACDLRFFCGGSCRLKNKKERGGLLNGGCEKNYKQSLYKMLIQSDDFMFDIL